MASVVKFLRQTKSNSISILTIAGILLYACLASCGGGGTSADNTVPSSADAAQSDQKITSSLMQKMDSNALTSTRGFKVAVKLRPGQDISDVLGDADVRYKAGRLVNAVFADMDKAAILRLAEDDRVEAIEENADVKINLFYATKQIGVRGTSGWGSGYTGSTLGGTSTKIRLAVIDTGIDEDHEDFAGRIAKKVDCYQVAACTEASGYEDDHGHGSHVSGIVLGDGSACDEAGDLAYIELSGTLSDVSSATRYFFPAQFETTPGGNISADMTWSSTIASTATIGFQSKDEAEAASSTFLYTFSDTKTGPSVVPGQYLSSGNYAVTGTAGARLMPHGFVASTTDSNATGRSFWARVKTVVEGWGDGLPRTAGISYGSELVSIKGLGPSGSGGIDDIVRSLEYLSSIAESNNIIAVNLSFSLGNGMTSDVLKTSCAGLVSKGVAVVVSEGNDQQQGSTTSSPSDEASVITVGAVNDQDQVTSYTTIGGIRSSVTKPDVMAPGGSYVTRNYILAPKTTYGALSAWNRANGLAQDPYALKIGTSQAAPMVVGLIGVMASKKTGGWAFNSSTMPFFYKMILCMTAFETGARESSTDYLYAPITPERAGGLKDRVEGYGRICAQGAMSALDSGAVTDAFTFGANPYDQKTFARAVSLSADNEYNFTMAVPAGADYDLYLFSSTPDANGEPVLLASSALADNPTERITDFIPQTTGTYYLVAKWISGSGASSFAIGSTQARPATPTAISNFRLDRNMRDKKIIVSWRTNVPALSSIQYGTTGGLGQTQSGTGYTTEHSFSFDIGYDGYYYVRGLSSSAGNSDLEISTAVTPVYRSVTYGELLNNISIEDLPIVDGGGCGSISGPGAGSSNSSGAGLALMLLPLLMLLALRMKLKGENR